MDRDVNSLRDNTRVAIDKRLEIMNGLINEMPDSLKDSLKLEVKRIMMLKERLNSL